VGYVPGSYNPITDLYDVQAKDAHAWVQVWFPGYGWQNFDPTAVVPLANPSPGSVLAHSTTRVLSHLPWIPIGAVAVIVVTVVVIRRRRRLRPPTWAHQVAVDLERGGARRGRRRRIDETLSAYGERLAAAEPVAGDGLLEATRLVERCTYGGVEPSADQIAATLAVTRRFAGGSSRLRSRNRSGSRSLTGRSGGRGGRGRSDAPPQERDTASASSNEAPAASRGR
jgi:hypothetical protein